MSGRLIRQLVIVVVLAAVLAPAAAQAARIKDIAQIDGVRDNQLMGYGLVGGLAGTGDDPKSAPFTAEAIANMLANWGFTVTPETLKVKNFAAVMVTADLPPYVSNGDRLDVTVSSIGSAKSLEGGILYQTLLKGADGNVYAVAQGSVSMGNAIGGGRGKQHLTVGRVPGGALIEGSVPSTLLKSDGGIHLNLTTPDFTTATAVVEAVNLALGGEMARAIDAGTISVRVPLPFMNDFVPFIALIENLDVDPGGRARVIVNQRTGTIVIGHNVEILPVAVTHGTMTLTFGEEVASPGIEDENPENVLAGMTQPPVEPGNGDGTIAAQPLPELDLPDLPKQYLRSNTTAEKVAMGLNKMNLSPTDIVAIFEAIDAAGALLGDLEVI